MDHLTNGRPWDLNRKKDGLRVFNFGDFNPQYDDVHNFLDNIDFFEKSKREYVLLSPSYILEGYLILLLSDIDNISLLFLFIIL